MPEKTVALFAVISAWIAFTFSIVLGLVLGEFPVPLVLGTGIIAISIACYWAVKDRNS